MGNRLAVRPSEEFANLWTFVVGYIVANHMHEAHDGTAGFDLGNNLHGADPVHGGRLDKGRIKILKIECTMDVHAPALGVIVTAGF